MKARARGPLVPFLWPSAVTRQCRSTPRTYGHPFWRAPYETCYDSLYDRTQTVEYDADDVVTELVQRLDVEPDRVQAAWDSVAAQLTARFGPPENAQAAPTPFYRAELALAHWRTHCAAWQGPDSVQAALWLGPNSVEFPVPRPVWSVTVKVRNGPLPDSPGCDLRATSPP